MLNRRHHHATQTHTRLERRFTILSQLLLACCGDSSWCFFCKTEKCNSPELLAIYAMKCGTTTLCLRVRIYNLLPIKKDTKKDNKSKTLSSHYSTLLCQNCHIKNHTLRVLLFVLFILEKQQRKLCVFPSFEKEE